MKYSINKQCGKVICGEARFTVISPTLIRLEHDRGGGFCDLPSLFAQNRDAYCCDFDARLQDGTLVLTTAGLLLR